MSGRQKRPHRPVAHLFDLAVFTGVVGPLTFGAPLLRAQV